VVLLCLYRFLWDSRVLVCNFAYCESV